MHLSIYVHLGFWRTMAHIPETTTCTENQRSWNWVCSPTIQFWAWNQKEFHFCACKFSSLQQPHFSEKPCSFDKHIWQNSWSVHVFGQNLSIPKVLVKNKAICVSNYNGLDLLAEIHPPCSWTQVSQCWTLGLSPSWGCNCIYWHTHLSSCTKMEQQNSWRAAL